MQYSASPLRSAAVLLFSAQIFKASVAETRQRLNTLVFSLLQPLLFYITSTLLQPLFFYNLCSFITSTLLPILNEKRCLCLWVKTIVMHLHVVPVDLILITQVQSFYKQKQFFLGLEVDSCNEQRSTPPIKSKSSDLILSIEKLKRLYINLNAFFKKEQGLEKMPRRWHFKRPLLTKNRV